MRCDQCHASKMIKTQVYFCPKRVSVCVSLVGVPPPPVLVKAEVTPAPKDGPVKKAVPSQFPLLERVKGKSSEQLKALEESFQRSGSPTEADLGKAVCQLIWC